MWSGLTLPIHFPKEHCQVPKLRQGSISIWHFNWSTLCHNIFQLPQERQLLEEKEKRVFSSTIYHYNRKKCFTNYDVILGTNLSSSVTVMNILPSKSALNTTSLPLLPRSYYLEISSKRIPWSHKYMLHFHYTLAEREKRSEIPSKKNLVCWK